MADSEPATPIFRLLVQGKSTNTCDILRVSRTMYTRIVYTKGRGCTPPSPRLRSSRLGVKTLALIGSCESSSSDVIWSILFVAHLEHHKMQCTLYNTNIEYIMATANPVDRITSELLS